MLCICKMAPVHQNAPAPIRQHAPPLIAHKPKLKTLSPTLPNFFIAPSSREPPEDPQPPVPTQRPPSQQVPPPGMHTKPTSQSAVSLQLGVLAQSISLLKQTPAPPVSRPQTQNSVPLLPAQLLENWQEESHGGRVQTPLVQSKPAAHRLLQAPQFWMSVLRSTQALSQRSTPGPVHSGGVGVGESEVVFVGPAVEVVFVGPAVVVALKEVEGRLEVELLVIDVAVVLV